MQDKDLYDIEGVVSKRSEAMENISIRLKEALGTIEGIIIEDKDLSISIHYRKGN